MVEEDPDRVAASTQTLPILCVKFDGVIHSYSARWRLAHRVILGSPVDGAFNFLGNAADHFCVCVTGPRNSGDHSRRALFRWFKRHGWPMEGERPARLLFPKCAPEGFLVVDERCFRFDGVFPQAVELTKFRSYLDS